MPKIQKVIYLILLFFFFVAGGASAEIVGPFWKNVPLTDRWMKSGVFIKNVPSYLYGTDFPPSNQNNTIPFTNGIATVRILGGWSPDWPLNGELATTTLQDADVFDAQVNLFSDRLIDRIKPYVNSGIKDITVVLDNIPPSLVDEVVYPLNSEGLNIYGQAGIPRDAGTSWLIGYKVARELKQQFPTVVFRYRVGTEANGETRFSGTEHDYFIHYTRVADGINRVDSTIEVMPFNASEFISTDISNNVSIENIARSLKNTNRKLSAQPVSFYIVKKDSQSFPSTIETRLDGFVTYWNSIDSKYGQSVSREIHEFGLLKGSSSIELTEEQYAAFEAEVILRSAQIGVEKLYHWHKAFINNILTPRGWVYSVLDNMTDGDWSYPQIVAATFHPETKYYAALSKFSNKSVLLASSLNPISTINEYKTPTIRIPLSSLPLGYDICWSWVRDSLDTDSAVIDSLTLKAFGGFYEVRGSTLIIRPLVKTNSVTALVFEPDCGS